jgi:4-diphosphocytidyl-2-C-methyl-D-erythritol kinase
MQMKKIVVYSPAKINLTLDVVSKEEKFHNISSLVSSISLCDKIIIKKRKDRVITLTEKGIKSGANLLENTAYLSAKLFVEKFNTLGVDITVVKKIPVANGLGGSSCDIAGVLNGMQKLFDIKEDITPLASALGSDAVYMLKGGFAVMSGRGDIVNYLNINPKLYLLLITSKQQVLAKDSYALYDTLNLEHKDSTKKCVEYLEKSNLEGFSSVAKNDLFNSSKLLCPSIEKAIEKLNLSGATLSLMSGSGSCVYGIFNTVKERNLAFRKLKAEFKERLIKAETI